MAQNTASDDPRSAQMKIDMAQHFDEYEYEYREDEDTHAHVVYEDEQVVVVADRTGHELREWASEFCMERAELAQFMHELAEQVCDHNWSAADPVVFDKLED